MTDQFSFTKKNGDFSEQVRSKIHTEFASDNLTVFCKGIGNKISKQAYFMHKWQLKTTRKKLNKVVLKVFAENNPFDSSEIKSSDISFLLFVT